MTEALAFLPVALVVWVGLIYIHETAVQTRHLRATTRANAWAEAFDGCRGAHSENGTAKCDTTLSLDVPPSDQPAVNDAMRDLWGGWARERAEAEIATPKLISDDDAKIVSTHCVPCNPVPKASLEIVRRTYADSRASLED